MLTLAWTRRSIPPSGPTQHGRRFATALRTSRRRYLVQSPKTTAVPFVSESLLSALGSISRSHSGRGNKGTHHPGEADRTRRPVRPIRTSLPPVQAGSAFASCISGPPRRSLTLRPTNSQTAFRRLLSPRLRPLRYLHDRWDSYPVGTTFTGAGLAPAGKKTDLCTAHLDQRTTE